MRIFIVTCDSFPNGMAATSRISNYARAIMYAGIDCEVVVAKRTERFGTTCNNPMPDGKSDSVRFHYAGGSTIRSSSVICRRIHDFADVFSTISYLGHQLTEGDTIISYLDDHPFLMTALVLFCKTHKVTYVAELCELPYLSTGRNKLAKFLGYHYVVHFLFPRFDSVISISDNLLSFAKQHCSSSCRHVKVPILVDYEKYAIPDLSSSERVPFIFHTGTLSSCKDGIPELLEAFGIAVNSGLDARFVSTGKLDGTKESELIANILDYYKIREKVIFLGYITDDRKADLLSKSSLVVINKLNTKQNRYCFPTKMAEYLAAGKQLIATDFGEMNNWLEDSVNAIIVRSGDTVALSEAISEAIYHPSSVLSEGARKLSRDSFDYKVNANKLLSVCRIR